MAARRSKSQQKLKSRSKANGALHYGTGHQKEKASLLIGPPEPPTGYKNTLTDNAFREHILNKANLEASCLRSYLAGLEEKKTSSSNET